MDRLPLELLTVVIRALNQPSRAALARSSRRYYHLVLPYLYSDVLIGSTCTVRWEKKYPRFLHTVARRPDLGAAVHALHLQPWFTEPDLERMTNEEKATATYDIELFKSLVREQLELKRHATMWDDALEAGNLDAFLAVTLPRFTNLKRLSIEYPYHCQFFEKVIVSGAKGSIPLFPKLEEVFVTWYDTEFGVSSAMGSPFFSFPSMRKVGGSRVVEDEDFEDGSRRKPTRPESLSGVTEIDLAESNSSNGMRRWVELCRELKSFRVEHGGGMISDDLYGPRPFFHTLALHKTSLERLWIGDYGWEEYVSDEGEWIGSFADYTALKIICMRLPTLVEMDEDEEPLRDLGDIVPRSLETLCITRCGEAVLHWLPGQIERMLRDQRTPNLKTLIVDGGSELPRAEEKFHGVRGACQEAGITLYLGDQSYMDEIWPVYRGCGFHSHCACDSP